ncbi:MAG: BACON domain-containing protein [Candidatus Cryptobacteroides sp.]
MKKLALFVSLAAILMAGCKKDDPVIPEIKCDTDVVNVPVAGTEDEDIFVTFTSNVNWTASIKENVNWVSVSPASGTSADGRVKLIVLSTEENDPREATLVLTADTAVKEIKVVQAQVDAFSLVETSAELGEEGGNVEIKAMTNIDWTVTIPTDCDWVSLVNVKAYGESVKTVKVEPYSELDGYREAVLTVAAGGDEVEFTIYQEGPSSAMWHCNPTSYSTYTADSKVRLAKYGEYLLLSNGTKVLVLNPADGSLVNTITLPVGYNIQSLCVDDGNHILAAADANYGETLTIFRLDDISNIDPKVLLTFETGNYYGVDCGNVRVKGDITKDAVVTATVSAGAGGAVLYWQITSGQIQDSFSYVAAPYEGSTVSCACGVALGTKASDGFLYIGYGGDYNLKYYNGSEWSDCYVTGSSWMENYNCISTAEFKGRKYAAIVKGCHFDYDATDAVLLDITDISNVEEALVVDCDSWVSRDDNWANLDWADAGAYSDVLLVPGENELYMFLVDANYNVIGGVMYK